MKRREFIVGLGGAAASFVAARAQQGEPLPRIGALLQTVRWEGSWEAFTDALRQLGWSEGKNIQIDRRFSENPVKLHELATELVGMKPNVLFAVTTIATRELERETKAIPIVFVSVTDPVASGLVASLSRPGGNITGFSNAEPIIGGKHIEIFKEIAPEMTSVVCMFNPDGDPAFLSSAYPVMGEAAQHHALDLTATAVRTEADIERVILGVADKKKTGLFVAGEPFMHVRLPFITSLTTRHRIVSVCPFRYFVERGCLISYGIDLVEEFRQAAGYIDRILRGASPADLPVQGPTKFEMAVNLKTARAMSLTIPSALLARADVVID